MPTNAELIAEGRSRTDSYRTHWVGCWSGHDRCLANELALRLEKAEALIALCDECSQLEKAEQADE